MDFPHKMISKNVVFMTTSQRLYFHLRNSSCFGKEEKVGNRSVVEEEKLAETGEGGREREGS